MTSTAQTNRFASDEQGRITFNSESYLYLHAGSLPEGQARATQQAIWLNGKLKVAVLAAQAAQREADAELVVRIKQYYRIEIFPEPPSGQHGQTVDACSAAANRVLCDSIEKEIRSQEHE